MRNSDGIVLGFIALRLIQEEKNFGLSLQQLRAFRMKNGC